MIRVPIYELISATGTVVSVSDVKEHLEVDFSDRDTYIGTLINAAVEYVEDYTRSCLRDCTYKIRLGSFSGDEITLDRYPLKQVTSVKYFTGGTEKTIASSDYTEIYGTPAMIYLDNEVSADDRPDSLTIEAVFGYTTVPDIFIQAIKLLVGYWYEQREETMERRLTVYQTTTVRRLLNMRRMKMFG